MSILLRPLRHMWHQYKFQAIARSNGLTLNRSKNKDGWITLEEIFIKRTYADYFPFYTQATVLDIGAHKGYFSLFANQHLLPGSTIIALEPDAENLDALYQNLADNGANQVQVLEGAIHTSDETIQLFCSASTNHTLFPDPHLATQMQKREVQGIQLFTLMKKYNLEKVDFLKLDCEGAEYEVLFHLPEAVFDKIEVISMEFHDLKKPGYTALNMAQHLGKMGYEILKLEHLPSYRNLNYGRLIARKLKSGPAPKF